MSDQRDSPLPATPFGRIPSEPVRAGALAKLSRGELAVYMVLAAHARGAEFESWPAAATIARLAGLSCERSARRVLARLRERGLIRAVTGGGSGRTTRFFLLAAAPAPGAEPGPAAVRVKPGPAAVRVTAQTRTAMPKNPDRHAEKPGPPEVPQTREQKKEQQPCRQPDSPAVAPAGSGDAAALLEELRVAPAIARQLVKEHGERRVREVAGWAAAKAEGGTLEGTPAAYAVAALRGGYEEPAEVRGARAAETEAEARRRRDAAIARRRARISRDVAAARAETAAALRAYRALALHERRAALEAARRGMLSRPPVVLSRWWRARAWALAVGRAARASAAATAGEEAAA